MSRSPAWRAAYTWVVTGDRPYSWYLEPPFPDWYAAKSVGGESPEGAFLRYLAELDVVEVRIWNESTGKLSSAFWWPRSVDPASSGHVRQARQWPDRIRIEIVED